MSFSFFARNDIIYLVVKIVISELGRGLLTRASNHPQQQREDGEKGMRLLILVAAFRNSCEVNSVPGNDVLQ
jgi:hypothetical protein